ncbi:MAG: TerB N-terminal domain-containing protein [Oscillospiraceae bacterium]|nr:TerB N-terminal domain-containing protein [Oscillospiraceae bacterium]
MDEIKFAEIEITAPAERPSQGETAVQFFRAASQTEPLPQREIDPIREKFHEMRKLSSQKPFARTDAELFYKQAKFMEDFTDDYSGNLGISMYYPYYQHMGYENLRTYFTWRTKARDGELRPTSTSYIFLYIYELLSGIGVSDPADGLRRLLNVRETYSTTHISIEKYMPMWLKDYHVFYELPHSFFEFVEMYGLEKYYSVTLLLSGKSKNRLDLLKGISAYDVTKSKFLADGHKELYSNCLQAVLDAVETLCAKNNHSLMSLFVYNTSKKTVWRPFKNALFGSDAPQADREVLLSDYEQYACKNGAWSVILPIFFSSQKEFVGYLLKKTESCLRNAVNYKFKLIAETKVGNKGFMELSRISSKKSEFDKVIEQAVAQFYKESTRTVVTVNHKNLSKIREEALETQEQLIVEDDDNRPEPDNQPQISLQAQTPAEDDSNRPARSDYSPLPISEPFPEPENGWTTLKNALTQTELKALSIVLQDSTGVKAFADECGIMLEVLADSINEKATDHIGDGILEVTDSVMVYDEYTKDVESMIES